MTRRKTPTDERVEKVAAALVSWAALNAGISEMDEEDVLLAMANERSGANRPTFIKRLTQRLSGIKMSELKKEIGKIADEV